MKKLINNSRFKLIHILFKAYYSPHLIEKSKRSQCSFYSYTKNCGTSTINELESKIGLQLLRKTSQFLTFPNKGPVSFGHVSYLNLLRLGIVNNDFHKSSYKFCIVRIHIIEQYLCLIILKI